MCQKTVPVEDLSTLIRLVDAWTGSPADAERWVQALTATRDAAADVVSANVARALAARNQASRRRRGAARRRLQRELGRYLVAHDRGTADLNGEMYRLMQHDGEEARRLRRAFELLGGVSRVDSVPDKVSLISLNTNLRIIIASLVLVGWRLTPRLRTRDGRNRPWLNQLAK